MAARFVLFEDALAEEKLERKRRRRSLRNQLMIRTIPDPEFINSYRLNRELFEQLCGELVPLLPIKGNRRAIDPIMKILTTLNFYGRGSYQGSVGLSSDTPMAQQTVSKCIKEVTNALNTPQILQKYIHFPQNRAERSVIKQKFYTSHGIPGVCGCIDCTHIAIIRPREHEERYFNRKHYHSLNVQMICDNDLYILNVDASYGGATHDSFIWGQSDIRRHMESLTSQGESVFLLGDSGYHLRSYMITPIENAIEDSPEGVFNIKQKRARSTIERTFGVLKGRWRCLLAARELHYNPEAAGKITVACCVLHNMCLRAGLVAPNLTSEDIAAEQSRQDVAHQHVQPHTQAQLLLEGRRVRNNLVASIR